MTKFAELPGAEISLKVKYLLSKSNVGSDTEEFVTQYREKDYIDGEWVDVGPHFTTAAWCNDTFFWGSADAERITEENIHILEETLDELDEWYKKLEEEVRALEPEKAAAMTAYHEQWQADNPDWDAQKQGVGWNSTPEFKAIIDKYPTKHLNVMWALTDPFAARVRKLRPQGACYSRYPEEIWHLFNEAGPERETGFGNPYNPGEYKR